MILSVHLVQTPLRRAAGLLRTRPRATGAIWAQPALTLPLAAGPLAPLRFDGAALISAWADEPALDDFLAHDPAATAFAGGFHARLQPLRASGAWASLPGLEATKEPTEDDEPVAVLTLGRLRPRRAPAFLRTTAPAERQAVEDEALVLSTAMARPPGFVATFSVWRTAAAMRDYAYRAATPHVAAIRAHRAKPFHHESLFARFRPYAVRGAWRGSAP